MRPKIVLSFAALLIFGALVFFWQKPAAIFYLDCIAQGPGQSTAVVIIPGSKEKIPPLFRGLARKFYASYGVSIGENDWPEKLREYLLQNSEFDICIFSWSGGITEKFSLKPAGRALAYHLEHDPHRQFMLFGKSLGGLVGERAIQALKAPQKVSKLVYVATPHRSAHIDIPENIQIVNIFSEADRYLELANMVLYFGKGVKELENAENKHLPELKHSEFNENISLPGADQEELFLYAVYGEMLKSEKLKIN